jgi:HAD superfamily hydrolase (TIGR01509 family)
MHINNHRMIRNIIFDLGNVLLSWDPAEYLKKHNYQEQKAQIILNDIFRSDEWWHLDNGDITTLEAIDKIALKSTLNKDEIALVFNKRMEILYPLKNNIRLLPLLKKRGISLYYLSNFPKDLFEEVIRIHDFFKYFDGGIISSHARLSKPDIDIYKILLDKYQLTPDETLFFDDLNINVLGAKKTGIIAIHLDHSEKLSVYIENIIGLL